MLHSTNDFPTDTNPYLLHIPVTNQCKQDGDNRCGYVKKDELQYGVQVIEKREITFPDKTAHNPDDQKMIYIATETDFPDVTNGPIDKKCVRLQGKWVNQANKRNAIEKIIRDEFIFAKRQRAKKVQKNNHIKPGPVRIEGFTRLCRGRFFNKKKQ